MAGISDSAAVTAFYVSFGILIILAIILAILYFVVLRKQQHNLVSQESESCPTYMCPSDGPPDYTNVGYKQAWRMNNGTVTYQPRLATSVTVGQKP